MNDISGENMCESCNLFLKLCNTYQHPCTELYTVTYLLNYNSIQIIKMGNTEIEKSKANIMVEILEYIPNAVVSKTIVRKLAGNVNISSLHMDKGFSERISSFDTYIQIVDGKAEMMIGGVTKTLSAGDGIVVLAHQVNSLKASEQFKMISTVIKSGYE